MYKRDAKIAINKHREREYTHIYIYICVCVYLSKGSTYMQRARFAQWMRLYPCGHAEPHPRATDPQVNLMSAPCVSPSFQQAAHELSQDSPNTTAVCMMMRLLNAPMTAKLIRRYKFIRAVRERERERERERAQVSFVPTGGRREGFMLTWLDSNFGCGFVDQSGWKGEGGLKEARS